MIVAIAGFKGCGKGTVASVISEMLDEYGTGFEKVSSASTLKDAVAILFMWPRHLLEGDTQESREWREIPDQKWQHIAGKGVFSDVSVITPRVVLQRIGTNLFRDMVDDSFWSYRLKLQASSSEKHIVIDDSRFTNELEIANVSIRVTRPSTDPKSIEGLHISETEHLQWKYDHVIENNGTVHELKSKVRDVMKSYGFE